MSMEGNNIILAVWAMGCLVGLLYFWKQENIRARKRLLPLLVIAVGVLVFILMLYSAAGRLPLAITIAGVTAIYVWIIMICDHCGAVTTKTLRSFFLGKKRKTCPKCGKDLAS